MVGEDADASRHRLLGPRTTVCGRRASVCARAEFHQRDASAHRVHLWIAGVVSAGWQRCSRARNDVSVGDRGRVRSARRMFRLPAGLRVDLAFFRWHRSRTLATPRSGPSTRHEFRHRSSVGHPLAAVLRRAPVFGARLRCTNVVRSPHAPARATRAQRRARAASRARSRRARARLVSRGCVRALLCVWNSVAGLDARERPGRSRVRSVPCAPR